MRIELRDESLRISLGLRTSATKMRRTREETERLIIEALRVSTHPLSPTSICRALGRERSPYYIDIVKSMVDRGLLKEMTYQYRRNIVARVYYLSRG